MEVQRYLDSNLVKDVPPEQSVELRRLNELLDEYGAPGYDTEAWTLALRKQLECMARARIEPILPFRNCMQLLGAADNPQLHPSVLRLLLKRMPINSLGLLEKLVKALAAVTTSTESKSQDLCEDFGPLILRPHGGPFVKHGSQQGGGSSDANDASVRLLSKLVSKPEFFFDDPSPPPKVAALARRNSAAQRMPSNPSLPFAASQVPNMRSLKISAALQQQQKPSSPSSRARENADPGWHNGSRSSLRIREGEGAGDALARPLPAKKVNPDAGRVQAEAFKPDKYAPSSPVSGEGSGSPVLAMERKSVCPPRLVSVAHTLPGATQFRVPDVLPSTPQTTPSLTHMLSESRARLRKVLRRRGSRESTPEGRNRGGAGELDSATRGELEKLHILSSGSIADEAGTESRNPSRKRQLNERNAHNEPWRPPGPNLSSFRSLPAVVSDTMNVHSFRAKNAVIQHIRQSHNVDKGLRPFSTLPSPWNDVPLVAAEHGKDLETSEELDFSSPRQCSRVLTRTVKPVASRLMSQHSIAEAAHPRPPQLVWRHSMQRDAGAGIETEQGSPARIGNLLASFERQGGFDQGHQSPPVKLAQLADLPVGETTPPMRLSTTGLTKLQEIAVDCREAAKERQSCSPLTSGGALPPGQVVKLSTILRNMAIQIDKTDTRAMKPQNPKDTNESRGQTHKVVADTAAQEKGAGKHSIVSGIEGKEDMPAKDVAKISKGSGAAVLQHLSEETRARLLAVSGAVRSGDRGDTSVASEPRREPSGTASEASSLRLPIKASDRSRTTHTPPPPPPPLPPKKLVTPPNVPLQLQLSAAVHGSGAPTPPPLPAEKGAHTPAPPPPPLPPKKGASTPAPPPPPMPPKRGTPAPPPPPPPKSGIKTGGKTVVLKGSGGTPGAKGGVSQAEVGDSVNKRRRVKQFHWEKASKFRNSIWEDEEDSDVENMDDATQLFEIVESKAEQMLKMNKEKFITFVEQSRAQNINIVLTGIRKPFAEIKETLRRMDFGWLTTTQLSGLLSAFPDIKERQDLEAYVQGKHLQYRGLSDIGRLAPVDRFLLDVKDIPRLQQQIKCCLVTKTFAENARLVAGLLSSVKEACAQITASKDLKKLLRSVRTLGNILNAGTPRADCQGFKLSFISKLQDIRTNDRNTTAMKYVLLKLEKEKGVDVLNCLRRDMPALSSAAGVEMPMLRSYIIELETGLASIGTELANSKDEISEINFLQELLAFQEQNTTELACIKKQEGEVKASLERLTTYLGEKFDAVAPCKILVTLKEVADVVLKAGMEIHESRVAANSEGAVPKD